MRDFPFFTHAHRGCYVRRQVKHGDNNLVEVVKGTLIENLESGLCGTYPSPLYFFTPNEFKIILKNITLCTFRWNHDSCGLFLYNTVLY